MNKTERFYKCEHCGNIIGLIEDTGVPVYCCGEAMKRLEAKDSCDCDDKKLPFVKVNDKHISVFVGPCKHDMDDTSHIGWVYVETNQGGHRKSLCKENRPEVCFELSNQEHARRIFAYCNKHGLWKTEVSANS
ncbi:MAG: desulfoferrodoxin family protein [Bacillota bacterium]